MTDIVISNFPAFLTNRFVTCWTSFYRSVAFLFLFSWRQLRRLVVVALMTVTACFVGQKCMTFMCAFNNFLLPRSRWTHIMYTSSFIFWSRWTHIMYTSSFISLCRHFWYYFFMQKKHCLQAHGTTFLFIHTGLSSARYGDAQSSSIPLLMIDIPRSIWNLRLPPFLLKYFFHSGRRLFFTQCLTIR